MQFIRKIGSEIAKKRQFHRYLLKRNVRLQSIKTQCGRCAVVTTTDLFGRIDANFGVVSSKKYSVQKEEEFVDSNTFEKVCEETLESLCEIFEEAIEKAGHLKSADVSYGVSIGNLSYAGSLPLISYSFIHKDHIRTGIRFRNLTRHKQLHTRK